MGTVAVSGRTCRFSRSALERTGFGLSLVRLCRQVGPDAEERRDLGLAEFCEPYETIELWFDPDPNDQLLLIWLLDYFQAHPKTATKLVLRLVDFDLMMAREEELRRWEVFDVLVTEAELETASMSWQAYRAYLSISKCTKTITVTRGTSAARWRSLNLAKPSSRERTISAGTTPFIAGGAAPN